MKSMSFLNSKVPRIEPRLSEKNTFIGSKGLHWSFKLKGAEIGVNTCCY